MNLLRGINRPATPLKGVAGTTTNTTALVGAEADLVAPPQTNLTTGRFAFPVSSRSAKMIEILATVAGSAISGRVKLWRKVMDGQAVAYSPVHAFDFSCSASTASVGVALSAIDPTLRHCTGMTVSPDSLPSPGARVVGALMADGAQPVLFDPLDVDFITVDLLTPGGGVRAAALATDINPD
ncbi:MAG TPA: hypothetical protein VFF65_02090 [Phycisphaerales bacterium]|nr:hypothetical protein [Phycisphaerales bacterium]